MHRVCIFLSQYLICCLRRSRISFAHHRKQTVGLWTGLNKWEPHACLSSPSSLPPPPFPWETCKYKDPETHVVSHKAANVTPSHPLDLPFLSVPPPSSTSSPEKTNPQVREREAEENNQNRQQLERGLEGITVFSSCFNCLCVKSKYVVGHAGNREAVRPKADETFAQNDNHDPKNSYPGRVHTSSYSLSWGSTTLFSLIQHPHSP